jgi:hypothetical protein
MGVGASNLSISRLNVYQEAVNKIGQNLRAKAHNSAKQVSNVEQTIDILIGVSDKCEGIFQNKDRCDKDCQFNSRTPTYQCQFRTNQGTDTNTTNTSNCDAVYGTLEQAKTNDGTCDGTRDMDEEEREQICLARAVRLTCPNNPERVFNSNNQGVPEPSGVYGYSSNTCNDDCTTTIYIKTGTNGTNKTYDYEFADGQPYYEDPGGERMVVNTGNFFTCRPSDDGGINWKNDYPLSECLTDCAKNNKCDVLEERYYDGVIDCGGTFCASNTANVSLGSEQLADSNIKSEMTANITNDFQSEVMKTITQANEGLNFSQFNTSDEFTQIIQSIKNQVTNNISSSATNELDQEANTNQSITIKVFGKLFGNNNCPTTGIAQYTECDKIEDQIARQECQEAVKNSWENNTYTNDTCVPPDNTGGCGCLINNSTVQELSNKQEAKAVIDSIFDTTILNELSSKYTLTVDQLNKGPSFNWIYIIIAIILGLAWVAGKLIGSSSQIIRVLLSPAVLFIVFLVLSLIFFFTGTSVGEGDDVSDPKDDPCLRPDTGCALGGGIDAKSCNTWPGCEFNEETAICETLPDSNCRGVDTDANAPVESSVNAPICDVNAPACEFEEEQEIVDEVN